jgi:hypothetical protein
MREFDALCLPPCRYTAQGKSKDYGYALLPANGPSLKLLNLVDRKGLEALA